MPIFYLTSNNLLGIEFIMLLTTFKSNSSQALSKREISYYFPLGINISIFLFKRPQMFSIGFRSGLFAGQSSIKLICKSFNAYFAILEVCLGSLSYNNFQLIFLKIKFASLYKKSFII